jgi:beta-galactosidase/beta-glucuronidase
VPRAGGAPQAAQPLTLSVAYTDPAGKAVGKAEGKCGGTGELHHHDTPSLCAVADVALQSPPLWSPDSPAQHTATIELRDGSGQVLDTQAVKFGAITRGQ